MRTYVWNLTDLFDDNRLESLTATSFYYMMVKYKITDHISTRDQAFGQNFRPKNWDSPEREGYFLGQNWTWPKTTFSFIVWTNQTTTWPTEKSRVQIWAIILFFFYLSMLAFAE